MKIMIVGGSERIIPLVFRLQAEGNEVVWKEKETEFGSYLARQASSTKVDLDIFANSSYGDTVDEMQGFPVLGSNVLTTKLSRNHTFRSKIFETYGLNIAVNEQDGISCIIGGFFNGIKFIRPIFYGGEYKRIGANNTGPEVMCSGIALKAANTNNLFRHTLNKLTPFLKLARFRGLVRMDCLIHSQKVFVEEISFDIDDNIVLPFLYGLDEDLSQLFLGLGVDRKKNLVYDRDWIVGVSELIFDVTRSYEVKISNVFEFIFPLALNTVVKDSGLLYYSTDNPVVLMGFGSDRSVEEASRKAYARIKSSVRVEDRMGFLRPDIGSKMNDLIKVIKELK